MLLSTSGKREISSYPAVGPHLPDVSSDRIAACICRRRSSLPIRRAARVPVNRAVRRGKATPKVDVRFVVLPSGTEMVFQSLPSNSSAYFPLGDQLGGPDVSSDQLRAPVSVSTKYESS